MKIAFVAVAAFLSCSPFATAQMERTVYQSFEIDSVQTITLDIVGDYEVNVWAGNSILTETNIQIWKASPHLLDYFIEEGRYEIVATTTPSSATLSSISVRAYESSITRTSLTYVVGSTTTSPNPCMYAHSRAARPFGVVVLQRQKLTEESKLRLG